MRADREADRPGHPGAQGRLRVHLHVPAWPIISRTSSRGMLLGGRRHKPPFSRGG
jgi:hypothetical protein